jgi:DNA-binding NarL/FixJ family response regulator
MLAVLLADQNGLRVRAVASSTESARHVDVRTLDVALIDLRLPDGDGIRLGRELRLRRPGLGILVLSASDSISTLLDVPGSEAAGWGFLSKNSSLSASALVYAIRAVAAGVPCSTRPSGPSARSAATARSPGSAGDSAKSSLSLPTA